MRTSVNNYARIAYLKFMVSGLTETISNATLKVYSTTQNGQIDLHEVADNVWDENRLTWNNMPALGALIASPTASPGTWIEIDVSSYIVSNGTYSFAIQTPVDALGELSSKEGSYPPVLEITAVAATPNSPPAWSENPFTQAAATEDTAYSKYINWRASDPESDPLTFAKVSGPAWLTVANASNGKIVGTPTQADVGNNVFIVSVSDGINPPVEATMNLEVLNVNDAPVFTADPIIGTDATEDSGYNQTINGSAVDEDSDLLTYSKVSGPAWLSVASGGALSGTPTQSDVGANVFTVQVDDGNGGTDTATLNITVVNVNDAPVFTADPINKPNAYEDSAYSDTIAGSATDEESDPLSYSKVSGPAWLSVASDGALSGTPTQSDVGANVFTVQVDDGNGGTDTATLNITVVNVNDAPVFTADPINKPDADEGVAYSDTINGSATDADSDPLTYAKVSGPAWLTVAANGALSGTPEAGDVGSNSWTVQVDDGNGGTDQATLEITVVAAPPSWTELTNDDFESGWGNWVDGGSDARLATSWAVGSQCFAIQDNSGSSEVEMSGTLDLSGYSQLKINFSYVVQSFENAEDFWVRFSSNGGSSWQTIKAYVNDVDFVDDGTRYNPELIIDSGSYTFNNNVKIMFECDASGNADDVYIDNVVISAQ